MCACCVYPVTETSDSVHMPTPPTRALQQPPPPPDAPLSSLKLACPLFPLPVCLLPSFAFLAYFLPAILVSFFPYHVQGKCALAHTHFLPYTYTKNHAQNCRAVALVSFFSLFLRIDHFHSNGSAFLSRMC